MGWMQSAKEMKDFATGRNPVVTPIFDECIESIQLYALIPVEL